MKVSIFLQHIQEIATQKSCSLPTALNQAQKAGIAYVEADYATAHGNESALKQQLMDAGLSVSGMNAFFDFAHEQQIDLMHQAVDTAAALSAELIMAVPGFVGEGDDLPSAKERMAVSLNTLCALAREQGLSVAIEDFNDTRAPYGHATEVMWFLDKVPDLGCNFDTGNFIYFGDDVLKAYDMLESRITHVHMKDITFSPLRGEEGQPAATGKLLYPAPVGSGELPMAEVVRRLYERKYQGVYAIEHYGARDQLVFMRQSSKWLNNIIG